MKEFKIGKKYVGQNHPVYIVFEAGHTHGGFENAKHLVNITAEAGADAIKFQAIDAERLISTHNVMDEYEVLLDKKTGERETVIEPLIESHKRQMLSNEEYAELKSIADKLGLAFIITVDFPEVVDFMKKIDVAAFKICSGDVIHHSFIRHVAKTKIPIMIDTGGSTLAEVEQAMDVILSEGNEKVLIHHCPSGYPARLESINLNIIKTLKQMFECPIAFSDHTPGWDMDIAAVALGVAMIEKTITLDRLTRSAEHVMSLEADDAKEMVKSIRALEIAMGKKRKVLSLVELEKKLKFRRSLFAKKNLKAEQALRQNDIDYRRPGTGIVTNQDHLVIGRILKRDIKAGTMLSWKDFE